MRIVFSFLEAGGGEEGWTPPGPPGRGRFAGKKYQ